MFFFATGCGFYLAGYGSCLGMNGHVGDHVFYNKGSVASVGSVVQASLVPAGNGELKLVFSD